MQTIIIRIILNEESHDLQLSSPTVSAALREHNEFLVLFQRETPEFSGSNQPCV